MDFIPGFLGTMFLVTCALLVIVVLLQKGRGGGLGAAFGGAGSSAFGTRTGDVFTWVTIVLTALFLLLAIGSTLAFRPKTGQVATPTVDQTGPIESATHIMIKCSTGSARIAVTTDESEPLEDKAERIGMVTVTVKPGQTLKARAFREKWQPSEILSVVYDLRIEPESKPALPSSLPVQP